MYKSLSTFVIALHCPLRNISFGIRFVVGRNSNKVFQRTVEFLSSSDLAYRSGVFIFQLLVGSWQLIRTMFITFIVNFCSFFPMWHAFNCFLRRSGVSPCYQYERFTQVPLWNILFKRQFLFWCLWLAPELPKPALNDIVVISRPITHQILSSKRCKEIELIHETTSSNLRPGFYSISSVLT